MRNHVLLTPYFLDQPAPLLTRLADSGSEVNTPTLAGDSSIDRMAILHRRLADLVAATVLRGDRPVSIAGDCCTTIGVVAGLQRAGVSPVLVWLDAHGDFNTWQTTVSGFIGGMPLAMLVGRGDQGLLLACGCVSLPETDVFLADARDLDPAERELLEGSGVRRYSDLLSLAGALPADRPVYLHFDTDLLNPLDAPAMAYATAGGPRLDEVREFGDRLARTDRLAAVSMTTWDLLADTDRKTEETCLAALRSFLE